MEVTTEDVYRTLARTWQTVAEAWQALETTAARERDYWRERCKFIEETLGLTTERD